jgi:hypothetical protein
MDMLGNHCKKNRNKGRAHSANGAGNSRRQTATLLLARLPAPQACGKKMVSEKSRQVKTTPEHDERIANMTFSRGWVLSPQVFGRWYKHLIVYN